MSKKNVVIIGAGPAGLTAAYELLQQSSDYHPIILEATDAIGGISKTVEYKGNRIDIGGHRFFSKSDRVMNWWQDRMPMLGAPAKDDLILERDVELSEKGNAPDPEKEDNVLLIRNRLSRILFLGKFFDYPITLSTKTVGNLGVFKMAKIGFSYIRARLFPIKNEQTLEEFFINRFGRELYATFFRDYTEKVWGVPCDKIKAEWGAQRIKGLSITKTVAHALKKLFESNRGIAQKEVETSLIERFLYPKYGPGQMWELVANLVKSHGGEIKMEHKVVAIHREDKKIHSVTVETSSGERFEMDCDHLISSMPVRDLIASMNAISHNVANVASGLLYRDFMTVGVLLNKLKIKNETAIKTVSGIVPDNWIYIQEPQVRVGRLQVFNNWSPYMVKDLENTVWIGLEYFCNEGDDLWNKSDEEMRAFGIDELVEIGVIEKEDVLDSVAIKIPKAYPAYFGTYDDFDQVREFVDSIENLYLIGRNGTHRYNNMDHSMLSAMAAAENIIAGISEKTNIWDVNTEKEYHESK
jgi:protoporphyrinogen oxidase